MNSFDQDREYGYDIINNQLQNKANVSKDNKETNQEEADKIYQQLPDSLQKDVDLAQMKGASTWLAVVTLTEHGFTLGRSVRFWLCGMAIRLPSKCEYGHSFNELLEHALSYAKGDFPSLGHYEIQDITTSLLIE